MQELGVDNEEAERLLAQLGRRRAKLLADTKANLAEIVAAIPVARRANVTQDKIANLVHLSRVTVQKYEPPKESS